MSELPHTIELEQSVLGAILKKPTILNKIICILINSDYFYDHRHKGIYEAITTIVSCGQPIDISIVADELQNQGKLEKIGGRVYLIELVESVASTLHATTYAEKVATKWRYRKIITLMEEAIKSAHAQDVSPDEIIANVSPVLVKTVMDNTPGGFIQLSSIATDVLSDLDAVSRGEKTLGIPTKFTELDEKTGGLQNGNLIIIAGRPRMGKTSLMNCIASESAKDSKKVGFVSAETRSKEFLLKSLCTEGRMDSLALKRGNITEANWRTLAKTSNNLKTWNYAIEDTVSIEINRLIASVSNHYQENGLDILFVDYLQQITTAQKYDNRRMQIDYIVNSLKDLAKTLDIPVVLGCQISRMVEVRGGNSWRAKAPTLADLKESGRIEEVADMVLALFRPELYIKKKKEGEGQFNNVAWCIILKQRNGPEATIDLHFTPEYTLFQNMVANEIPFGVTPL